MGGGGGGGGGVFSDYCSWVCFGFKFPSITLRYTYTYLHVPIQAVKDWLSFWKELFVTYVDGFVTKPDPTNEVCECEKTAPGPASAKWYERIVNETGDHYEALNPIPPHAAHGAVATRDKRDLAGPIRRARPQGKMQMEMEMEMEIK